MTITLNTKYITQEKVTPISRTMPLLLIMDSYCMSHVASKGAIQTHKYKTTAQYFLKI